MSAIEVSIVFLIVGILFGMVIEFNIDEQVKVWLKDKKN